jgi:hypothetical protein
MRHMAVIFALLVGFSSTSVFAACTKPSGYYSGTGSGLIYTNGTLTGAISAAVTIHIPATGNGTEWEVGKNAAGRYGPLTNTIPAIGTTGHSFDSTLCRGIVTLSNDLTYVYTVSNSGAVMTFTYYGDDTTLATYWIRLEKQ